MSEDQTAANNNGETNQQDGGDSTEGKGGREIVPLAAAAFLGGLAGAIIGSSS